MRTRKKLISSILAITVLCIFAVMLVLARAPHPVSGSFPMNFPESDKHEIAAMVHRDGYARSIRALRSGEFSSAWTQFRIARKQKVWTVRHQPDGQSVWVHVGYEDKSQSNGYSLTARYILRKKGEDWTISSSDI
jgi:hypothetical protein